MKDEIKEILDKLQKVANRETASRNALIEMKDTDYQLLLDNITNLQKDRDYLDDYNRHLHTELTNLQEQLHKASLDIQELTERDIWCPSNCDKLTKLQEENKRLRKDYGRLMQNNAYTLELEQELERYKNIIEEAKEYCKSHFKCMVADEEAERLLDILNKTNKE